MTSHPLTRILTIRHETSYRYGTPVGYTIQQLRLTPRSEPQQRVLHWQISTAGSRHAFTDAYNNKCEMLTITVSHEEFSIVASGQIEVTEPDRGRISEPPSISPLAFTVPTLLTSEDDSIRDFAARFLLPGARSHHLLNLSEAICSAVTYQSGATTVTTTASDALELGAGVCQDHAHLFIACCHTAGIPARYVSGYLDSGHVDHGASHAWVDVWVDEVDYSGWVSIDVTHACLQNAGYCRLAVGRDYESAAPVRGMRRGGSGESMAVQVDVSGQ